MKHVSRQEDDIPELGEQRLFVVKIMALPAVYGLLCLTGVVRVVDLLIGNTSDASWQFHPQCSEQLRQHGKDGVTQQCWAHHVQGLERWYYTDLYCADMYEAYVL